MTRAWITLVVLLMLSGARSTAAQNTSPEIQAAVRNAKIIRLVIEEDYGEAGKVLVGPTARRVLTYSGIQVVETSGATTEVTLAVRSKGRTMGANYSVGGVGTSSFVNTGAEVAGSISIERGNIIVYRRPFEAKIPVASSVRLGESYEPLRFAFYKTGFIGLMLEAVADAWGASVLVNALADRELSESAKKILRERKATGALVEALGRRSVAMDSAREFSVLKREVESAVELSALLRELGDTPPIPSDTIARFVKKLSHYDWVIRDYAAKILGNLRAVDALAGLVKGQYSPPREALLALGYTGERRAIPLLTGHLRTNIVDVGDAALSALVALRATDELSAALTDKEGYVRVRAAAGLGRISDASSVPALLRVLKDPEPRVRRVSAWALGEIGNQQAVEPLINLLSDKEQSVQNEAVNALRRITRNFSSDLGADPAKWRVWWQQQKQTAPSSSPDI